MLKIDEFIMRKVQDAYLWILDYTGVYVASIAAIAAIIGPPLSGHLDIIQYGIILFNVTVLIPYYVDQDKAHVEAYNMRAMFIQSSTLRIVATAFVLSIFVLRLFIGIFHDHWLFLHAISDLCVVLYLYLLTVSIRDREPKSFFEKREFAMQT